MIWLKLLTKKTVRPEKYLYPVPYRLNLINTTVMIDPLLDLQQADHL